MGDCFGNNASPHLHCSEKGYKIYLRLKPLLFKETRLRRGRSWLKFLGNRLHQLVGKMTNDESIKKMVWFDKETYPPIFISRVERIVRGSRFISKEEFIRNVQDPTFWRS